MTNFEQVLQQPDETVYDFARRHGHSEEKIEKFIEDATILLPLVPTTPGQYTDSSGDVWILDADGGWTDKEGVTKKGDWALTLGRLAPWTAVG